MIYNQETGDLIVEFDTYIENNYHNSNTVAFEPLENGSFSSDSKQNTPFVISITGIKNISTDRNVISGNSVIDTVDQVKQIIEDLAKSSTLVKIILQPMIKQSKTNNSQYFQYGDIYENLTLYSVDYQNTPDQLEFRPTMIFQEIRLTNTEYTQTQNTANPENSSTVNQGQKQPVKEDNSILKSTDNFFNGG